jgi:TolA-binding protein
MAHEVFFRFFGEHPRTPGLLMKFGDDQMAESNYFGALNYFVQVETNYPDSEYVADAIGRVAACYSRIDDQTNEIVTLEQKYIPALMKKERPGHALIAGKYRLATAYRRMGNVTKAYAEYKDIIDRLSEKPQEYQASGQDADANRNILEAALYYKAIGFTRMNPPAGKDENFLRLLAVQSFLKLVEQFPKSPFAPAALSQVGTLYTVMEKAQEAEEALKRLQKEYPGSEEAKNSYFMLGMNLLKLNLRTKAIQVFKEMFSGTSGRYSAVQIITAGQLLLDEGEAEMALEAFERVLSSGENQRAVVEPAMLGKGRSQVALKKWEEAIKTLEDLLLKFPRSGFTVEASRLMSEAYSETAKQEPRQNERIERFNLAVDSIHKAKRFERTPGGKALLDVEAARLLARKVEAEVRHGSAERATAFRGEAVAAYQGLMMFGDTANMEVRPHIEDAFSECIPLLLEMKKFKDALEDCDKYIELFPRGKHLLNIRNHGNQARIGLVQTGGTEPAAAGGSGAPAAAPKERTP